MNTSLIKSLMLLAFSLSLLGCEREVIRQYELEDVTLYSSASEKKNLKSDEQFIAILYADVNGKSINNAEMSALNRAYTSMGDKHLVIDLLIKGMLSNADAQLPTNSEMRTDPATFVEEAYKRFLVRRPTEQEAWFMTNRIEKRPDLEVIDIYYAILTSDEYRYY